MSNEVKQNNQPTGADIVVKTLEQHDVKWVFGVPGAKIDKVFNTLVDSSIQTVVCRHEQNAAFIPGGIGRMTGKAGIAIATSGPGGQISSRVSPRQIPRVTQCSRWVVRFPYGQE